LKVSEWASSEKFRKSSGKELSRFLNAVNGARRRPRIKSDVGFPAKLKTVDQYVFIFSSSKYLPAGQAGVDPPDSYRDYNSQSEKMNFFFVMYSVAAVRHGSNLGMPSQVTMI